MAGFGCAAVLLPYLLRGIVNNRDSTRPISSTSFEHRVVKAVKAALRQFVAGLVRTAAFFGLILEFVAFRPLQVLFCNQRRVVVVVAVSSA